MIPIVAGKDNKIFNTDSSGEWSSKDRNIITIN